MDGDDDEERSPAPLIGEPLPHADSAVIDGEKLVAYALDPDHPVGMHKAIVFQRALDVEKGDADYLMESILDELPNHAVSLVRRPRNEHEASTWEVLVPIEGLGEKKGRRLLVITAWEMKDDVPHLVTLRVAPEKRQTAG